MRVPKKLWQLTASLAALAGWACGPADRVGIDQISVVGAGTGGSGKIPTAGTSSASGRAAPPSSNAGSGGVGGREQAGTRAEPADAAGSGGVIASAAGDGVRGISGQGGTASESAAGGGATAPAPAGMGGAGEAGGGGATSPPEGGRAGAEAAECDLNGVWIARLTTFSRDTIFNSVQTTSNWFYYEIEQTGRAVRVSRALDCGLQVSGSADVTINTATLRSLLHPNDQTGRSGEFYRDGDHCSFKLGRWYSTRALARSVYLAGDLSQNPELSTLTPALPTEAMPDGAEDWDGDGTLGIALNITALGSRHTVLRDWNEFFSDDTTPVAFDAAEFVARAAFDSQESIMAVSGGLGALLRAGSAPATGLRHRITFRRLGRSPDDASVKALHVADEVETCYNVQEALPHDPVMQ